MITPFAPFEGTSTPGAKDAFRARSRDVTAGMEAAHFDGRIHPHVTERHEFAA